MHERANMIRLGVLGSTRGTNLAAIYEAISKQQLAAEITVVLSNKADAFILKQAQQFGLAAQFISAAHCTREEYDAQVSAVLLAHQVDLIILIGYMRILSASFVNAWPNRIINVHPSLLPAFAGLMDLDVHRAVLAGNAKETGCTVHYVTAEVDAGPILLQKKCFVEPADTPQLLKARVQALEGQALVQAIQLISR